MFISHFSESKVENYNRIINRDAYVVAKRFSYN